MQCANCGFMLAPLQTVCPRCQHTAGTPVAPLQSAPIAGRAVKAGFFGFIGAWIAALGLGCIAPAIGCVLVVIAFLVIVVGGGVTALRNSKDFTNTRPPIHSDR